MSDATDVGVIAEQERLLRFASFSSEMVWQIGSMLREDAVGRGAAMTFEIQLAGRMLFQATTGEAPAAQMDWIRRKRNTVLRFGRASYAMGLELAMSGKTLEARHEGLTLAEYAMHGGGFPILLHESGCVGTVVSSGLHQREDHGMVVAAMAAVLGVRVPVLPA